MKPGTMRVAELADLGQILIREEAIPCAGDGEVLVKTLTVGLCGTDIKAYRRGHPYFRPPCVLGHELVGQVAAVGRGVESVTSGQKVACAPYVECGVCSTCDKGLGELCAHKAFVPGALQQYVRVPKSIVRRGLLPLSGAIDDVTATLLEPLACALNGIERARVNVHNTVLVVGGGPMGTLLALLARSRGARVLIGEINVGRRERLERMELHAVDTARDCLGQALERVFGTQRADRVLIAVGDRQVVEEALSRTDSGGIALLFGGLPKTDPVCIGSYDVHYREVSLVGSFGFQVRHFQSAAEWAAGHAEELRQLVTDVLPFEHVADAFTAAERGDGMKVVVRVSDGD